jgi:Uma2 family endonuclease
MVGAPKRRATYADIEALPEHVTGEIIAGELVVSPRPAPRHIHAASALGVLINGPFGLGINGPGGWWIEDEPELHLGIDEDYEALVPDLAGWRKERMPELPETAYFSAVPDWICEILSPRTAAIDRAEKMPFYARAGVHHLWIIDAGVHTLEIFRLEGGAWTMVSTALGPKAVRAEPFAEIELELKHLWTALQKP